MEPGTIPVLRLVDTADDLRKYWQWVEGQSGPIGFDFETSGREIRWGGKCSPDAYRHELTGLSLYCAGHAVYVPVRHAATATNMPKLLVDALLRRLLEMAPSRRIWAHNLAYETNILINEGLLQPHTQTGMLDSQVAAWLAWTLTGRELKLKSLAAAVLGVEGLPDFKKFAGGRESRAIRPSEMVGYAALDAWMTAEIGERAHARLESENLLDHFLQLDMPSVEVLRGMTRHGVPRDVAALKELRPRYVELRDQAAAKFKEITTTEIVVHIQQDVPTGEFYKSGPRSGQPKTRKEKVPVTLSIGADIGNDRQVSRWMYDELKAWPIPEKWDYRQGQMVAVSRNANGVYPIGAKYVAKYAGLPGIGGQAALLRLQHAKYGKLVSTYVDALLELPEQYADTRVHANFNLTGTETQRLSSNQPNLQNIPARSDEARHLRRCLVADPGWTYVIRDYSQIELRLQADLAKDEPWIAAYDFGVDVHQATADALTEKLGTHVSRARGKEVNLSVIYRIGPASLASRIGAGCTVDDAAKLIDAFYAAHPAIKEYQVKAMAYSLRKGYAVTRDGYKRYLKDATRLNFRTRREELSGKDGNRACNTPVQGWSGGIIKRATLALWRRWTSAGVYGKSVMLVGSVHDELIVMATHDYANQAGRDMDELMVEAGSDCIVPILVEGGKGDSWASAK